MRLAPHMAVGSKFRREGEVVALPLLVSPGRRKAAPHEVSAAGKFSFDDRATNRRFGASIPNFGEVSFSFYLTIDSFLFPLIGSADSRDADSQGIGI